MIEAAQGGPVRARSAAYEHLVDVRGLSVSFATEEGIRSALADVSLEIDDGEVVALVGESGSAKTVTALSTIGLLPDTARVVEGSIHFEGRPLDPERNTSCAGVRGARMAMVFQEPMTRLNPVLIIGEQIAETIVRHRDLGWRMAHEEAIVLLDRVGIPDAARRARQYAHQLSGGMRQRVMIAGAVSCRPRLLIADEPNTALDVTVQAQILDLIRELQADLDMGVLFIAHDLAVVRHIADRVVVLYLGRVMESGPVEVVSSNPRHPCTQAPLSAVPEPDPDRRRDRIVLAGDTASPISPASGCIFRTRCPVAVFQ